MEKMLHEQLREAKSLVDFDYAPHDVDIFLDYLADEIERDYSIRFPKMVRRLKNKFMERVFNNGD